MTTTLEYWDVNGTALNTLAWNIETLTGRSRVPQLRGADVLVPYRPGELWQKKYPGGRTLTLAMWVLGCNPDGTAPATGSARAKFNDNKEALQRLFFQPETQLVLTKRWLTATGLKTAVAAAELVSDMDMAMLGIDGAQFVVDLRLADPYFYSSSVSTGAIAVSTPTVVTNLGQVRAKKLTIRFNGTLVNPKLTNTTTGVWVQYTGTITSPAWVQLDTDLFTAVDNAAANVIGGVSHQGARIWLELLPGANTLALTASSGAGNVSVAYPPPYL